VILIDIVPFFRFAAAIICFGLSFFFLGLMVTAFTDLISFEGSYATVLLSLWAILPAVVLLFSGIRLIMVKQKVM
jgi:hypothetical protein